MGGMQPMAYVCQTCGVRLAWLEFRTPHCQLIGLHHAQLHRQP